MIKFLISGGLDSFVMAQIIHRKHPQLPWCHPSLGDREAVFIDWDQPSVKQERVSAKICADYLGIPFSELKLNIDSKPMKIGADRPGPRVVPNRNRAFIEAVNCEKTRAVVIGCIKDDYNDYLDCRPEYIKSLSEELKIMIWAPLINLTKPEIIKRALSYDLPLHLTWSCYQSSTGAPCGNCNSCMQRELAFKLAR